LQEERRLAAILAADVAGYSRLMANDEAATLARLKQFRSGVIEPAIGHFKGQIVGSAGDSLLAEFKSALNAVECAVRVQNELASLNSSFEPDARMNFRIGVNVGDVIADANTIYGEGVNIAARLEKLAEPGGICIGRGVYEQIKSKLPLTFKDLGSQQVHNIPEPIQAYAVLNITGPTPRPTLPLPNKPSIAVLPFQNLSGDAEQEYFADGMVEEIVTALSRMRWLFVIARNSSFTYKGRAVDVKQVGRELGVRYVLEGSVRKSGNRMRITGQLIDATTGAHVWADRFEGKLEDIFDLQDQVTASVVGAIAPTLEQAEIERSSRKPTESLDAYDYYLRGMSFIHQWSQEATAQALLHFYRAIELDPGFASAYGMAARCYSLRKAGGWEDDRERATTEVRRLVRRAAELGKNDALALSTAGIALAFVVGELEDGDAMIDLALSLNPNLVWGWLFSGWVKVWNGEPEKALEPLSRALRISPHDPHVFSMHSAAAMAHLFSGRYSEACKWAQLAMRDNPNTLIATCTFAASSALSGQQSQAAKAMAKLRSLDPNLRLSNLHDWCPIRRSEDFRAWSDGLRQAGLPE
jgi:TolB-like protein